MLITIQDDDTVSYKDWVFSFDKKLTETLYCNTIWGKSDLKTEKEFQIYKYLRPSVFPEEILRLFQKLGIDYHKDSKLDHYIDDSEQHVYEGCFYFIGEMIQGKHSTVTLENNETYQNLTEIDNSFSIGFHCDNTCIATKPLMCVSFSISISSNIFNQIAMNL